MEAEVFLAAGTHTLSIGQFKGTNDGDLPQLGLKKTGKTLDTFYLEFVEWKDGKAKKIMPFQNGLEMAMQLGLVPEPGATPAEKPEATKPEAKTPEASATPPAKKLAPGATPPKQPAAEASADPNKKATAPN
jgi:hypothetical protein